MQDVTLPNDQAGGPQTGGETGGQTTSQPTDQLGGQSSELQGQPGGGGGAFSREDLSIGLIALGSIMMLIVIARMLGRRKPRARAGMHAPATAQEAAAPKFTSTASHDRLERLMADAEELTRRLAAVLDNKAAKIEVLIEQADERLRALEGAAARPGPAAGRGEAADARDAQDAPAPLSMDPLHRKVYDLADQGLTPVDIARKIDRPTGQVELILALRRA